MAICLGRTAPIKLVPPNFPVGHRAEVTLEGKRPRVVIDGQLERDTTVEGQAAGTTGRLWERADPLSRRRFGAWLWIVEQGTKCRVWFNGMLAAAGEVPAGEGRVGLRIHLEKSSVEFRDLRIRSL